MKDYTNDRFWKIWFPPVNLWSRPHQKYFDTMRNEEDRMVLRDVKLDILIDQINAFATAQDIPELELLTSLQDEDDVIWFLPVPRNGKAGLFLVFEPVTDKDFLSRLVENNYDVAICKRFDGVKNALSGYLA
jgi:hypothetical protein